MKKVLIDKADYALTALNDEFGTKASMVAQAYDDAMMDGVSSESCYTFAVLTAYELGGVEIVHSNSISFEFDDNSTITFEGCKS